MGHAHLLPRRAQIQAALKIQPMRAGVQRPVRPALTAVEFRDQPQPPIVGGIQVAGELGDLRVWISSIVAEMGRKVMPSGSDNVLILFNNLLKFVTHAEQPDVGIVVIAGAEAMPHAARHPTRRTR